MGDALGRVSHARSFAKAISWRITGAIDTFIISYLVTGRFVIAGSIVGVEVLSKTLLYYFHERLWSRFRWGVYTPERLYLVASNRSIAVPREAAERRIA